MMPAARNLSLLWTTRYPVPGERLRPEERRMVKSCLHLPDAATWHDDDAYSPSVARLLSHAHVHLTERDPRLPSAPPPDTLLRPVLGWRMSKRQRLVAYYLLARAAEARQDFADAIGWLDDASTLATDLLEIGALAELLRLRGRACQALQRFAEAADASWDFLVLLRDPRVGFGPDDLETEVDTRLTVAQSEFFLEHYDLALIALADADALIAGRSGFDGARVHVAWISALLHRWRGEASIALPIAMDVAEAPSVRRSAALRGRIETVVADLSMDRAEAFASDPSSFTRSTFLTIAEKYLRSSESDLADSTDTGAVAMARLARIRYGRLTARNEDRLRALDALETVGRKTADDALVIQALTARGDEFIARSEREPGLWAYRRALDVARHSQVAAMGMRARRALLYDQELRD
jgi:hypothetical protein